VIKKKDFSHELHEWHECFFLSVFYIRGIRVIRGWSLQVFMKQEILNNIKNIWGWRTKRKIVVFSVDDYGNVRLAGPEARENLDRAGVKVLSRFDAFDTLETRQDLELLFETLASVKDANGGHAVFTPFAVPCNIDFERLMDEGYKQYCYELLPMTYEKLSALEPAAYEGTWQLWQEGIAKGLLSPQFHGREHLNLKVFEEKLARRDPEVMACLANRSYTGISDSGYSTIGYTAAFDFWEFAENERFAEIIRTGLDSFEEVFGARAVHFTPPGGREHQSIHQHLLAAGVRYLDTPLIKQEHQGKGKHTKSVNWTGRKNRAGMNLVVRNVVFEPTHDRGVDWVGYAMQQVEAAFRWHRPANISSHRVNYCGHIDPANRQQGLDALRTLLREIVKKWPDVEFMGTAEMLGFLGKA